MKPIFAAVLLLTMVTGCAAGSTNGTAVGQAATNEVIDLHGNSKHWELLDELNRKMDNNEPASVRVTRYTIEGDPIYHDLTYKDRKLMLRYDTTKDKFGHDQVRNYACAKLNKEETQTQLIYTVTGCAGEGEVRDMEVLHLSFDAAKQDYFAFQLKYGADRSNEINTIDNKLVIDRGDGEAAAVSDFQLTKEERQAIYRRMVLSGYLLEKKLSAACDRKPNTGYYLKVRINGAAKEFNWSECDTGEDGQTMTRLANDIIETVKAMDEYKRLSLAMAPESSKK